MKTQHGDRLGAREGMAYVAILFILMVASLLALAFARDVGTQLSLLDDRASAMQAGYLAESAANHALWRVLGSRPEERSVADDDDDAEQGFSAGATVLDGSTLALGQMEYVGTRFLDVAVPKGARVLSAHVELTAAADETAATSVIVRAEASDSAGPFTTAPGDLSSRPQGARSVGWWNIPPWSQGSTYATPDLRFIVQELVNRAGWSSENDLVLLFESVDPSGSRSATSHDAPPGLAPKLVVVYEETGAPFDEGTYYLHSLAGGRYAYKVRKNTDTTFATVAAVGSFGGVEVHQSYVMNVQPPAGSLSPCLVGWWALDEGGGLVASDGSGSQNDGVLVNLLGTEWTAGVANGGLDLSRPTDFVDFGADARLQLPDAMTLALWVKPGAITNALLLDKGYQNSYYLLLKSDGSYKLACAISGAYWGVTSNAGEVSAGEWSHLAGTYDESTGVAILYKNGVEVMRASGLGLPILNNTQSLVLGARNTGTSFDLDGIVDDVRVYDCALSAQEMAELYCDGLSLVASAGADQAVLVTAGDSSVYGSLTGSCPLGGSGPVTTTWSMTSGPGAVVFVDASQLSTQVTFSLEGEYVLRLTAEQDGETTFDEVTFDVQPELYVESYQGWELDDGGQWETVALGGAPFNVPANAVVEVAIVNQKSGGKLVGGIRAGGSALNRTLPLHQPKDGGVDVVVMHAQTDGSSSIQCYAEDEDGIGFVLLGYWKRGVYVERFDTFSASSSGAWKTHNLSPYGVANGQVAEIVIENQKKDVEYQGGVRSLGSGNRMLTLHEADGGGVDAVTMSVQADDTASATIEVYAQSAADIRFRLTGYWSTAPGSFTEHFSDVGQPAAAGAWTSKGLGPLGVPPLAVAQLAMANLEAAAEQGVGLRCPGSSLSRSLQLHEAEDGGGDYATLHVRTDGASSVQWYEQYGGVDGRFYLLGCWTP